MRPRLPLALGILAALPLITPAIEIVYPPGSGVFNVVTDGGVDPSGKTDVTATLQRILNDGTDATGRRLQVIFFPKGTYLVSGELTLKTDRSRTPTSHSHGPWLIGESRRQTIIRLRDGTWTKPVHDLTSRDAHGRPPKRLDAQAVLSTGDCTNTTFNKIIRHFTINTGRNNPGAIGVQFNTSNSGCLSEVDIVSEDGQGTAGLALAGVENGPGQVRNVSIRGFDVGLYNVADYIFACSDIVIDGPRRTGVLNAGLIAGEDFTIRMAGSGPAVQVLRHGALALLGASLTGQGPTALANEEGMLYLRDLRTNGYAAALDGQPPTITEYTSGSAVGLFNRAPGALALPIQPSPEVPYERDFAKWANPLDFGAAGDGKTDDSAAVQRALNAPGKTHVIIPYGHRFRIKQPLTVGPEVERIVGTSGVLPFSVDDRASLTIAEGTAPVVIVEGLINSPPIIVRTHRTIVLNSVRVRADQPPRPPTPKGQAKIPPPARYFVVGYHLLGGGDVFIHDTGTPFLVDHPGQRVWVRHYNSELGQGAGSLLPIEIKAGVVWLLGWKSENLRQRVRVHARGALELTGFNNYEVGVGPEKDGDWPLFEVRDGQFSCTLLTQRGSRFNRNLVWELRHGRKAVLTWQDGPEGKNCSLYTGYDPDWPGTRLLSPSR